MTESEINEAKEKFASALRAWSSDSSNHKDGYTYEKSFVEMMRKISEETLQASLGEVPISKNKKKE